MNAPFDIVAPTYDSTFTHTVIGKLQRNYVYRHLSDCLDESNIQTLLEINCGTGEDAIWLSDKGFQVTATDISEKMLTVAQQKDYSGKITFRQADINTLPETFPNQEFDCIFSDFGGLNCLSETELAFFFTNVQKILSENGELFLVIMPKNTLWEQGYFLLKGKFSTIFRRKRKSVTVSLDGKDVTTYYYNPNDIRQLAQTHFTITKIKPIGFFIPPSYLEPFIRNKKTLTAILDFLENTIRNFRFLARYSDHYFIALRKR